MFVLFYFVSFFILVNLYYRLLQVDTTRSDDNEDCKEEFGVLNIAVNPSQNADMALLLLSAPSTHIPVALDQREPVVNDLVTAVGWKRDSFETEVQEQVKTIARFFNFLFSHWEIV